MFPCLKIDRRAQEIFINGDLILRSSSRMLALNLVDIGGGVPISVGWDLCPLNSRSLLVNSAFSRRRRSRAATSSWGQLSGCSYYIPQVEVGKGGPKQMF